MATHFIRWLNDENNLFVDMDNRVVTAGGSIKGLNGNGKKIQ